MKYLKLLILVLSILIIRTAYCSTNNASLWIADAHSYPNPFDNEKEDANILLTLSSGTNFNGTSSADVYIIIYDFNGNKAWTRKYAENLGGNKTITCAYKWAGVNDFGKKVGNGIYYCRIIVEAGTTVESKFKIVVE